ncbi:MAG: hypothetical protein U1F77_05615 [Kiritimatiellia bacterium]
MIRIVKTSIILVCILALAGCCQNRKIWRESLGRLDWSGGNHESRYVRDQLVATLKATDAADLRHPQLVDVVFYGQSPDAERAMIVFNWIASPPTADGAILMTQDGSTISLTFPQEYLDENAKQSKHHAICYAAISRRNESETWSKIDVEAVVSGQLTLNGKPVSNVCHFRRHAKQNEPSQKAPEATLKAGVTPNDQSGETP